MGDRERDESMKFNKIQLFDAIMEKKSLSLTENGRKKEELKLMFDLDKINEDEKINDLMIGPDT